MKKIGLFTAIIASAVVLVSCKPHSTLQKDIKHMQIRFKPLSRADVQLIGNLESQITITGKIGSKGKALDKSFAANYKKGLINKSEAIEMLYFAPGQNEVITGSLYDNEVFNNVFGSQNQNKKVGIFGNLLAALSRAKQLAAAADPGLDFGYFSLVEKYPDIDYFINVRFDRKTIVTAGGKFTETVIVKADGVKLKTD
jgi:hypothetical protein